MEMMAGWQRTGKEVEAFEDGFSVM